MKNFATVKEMKLLFAVIAVVLIFGAAYIALTMSKHNYDFNVTVTEVGFDDHGNMLITADDVFDTGGNQPLRFIVTSASSIKYYDSAKSGITVKDRLLIDVSDSDEDGYLVVKEARVYG